MRIRALTVFTNNRCLVQVLFFALFLCSSFVHSEVSSADFNSQVVAELHAHSSNQEYEQSVFAILDAIKLGELNLAVEIADKHLQLLVRHLEQQKAAWHELHLR